MGNKLSRVRAKGFGYGLASGFVWGLDPHIVTILLLMVPFIDGDLMFKLGIIGAAGMAAFFKEIFALIFVGGFQAVRKEFVPTFQMLKQKEERKAWGWVALSAIASGPIATTCYAIAVGMAGAVWPAMITSIYPVFAAILGAVFLKDKLKGRGWFAVVLIGVGLILLSISPPEDANYPMLTVGIIVAIITALAWGCEGVILSVGLRNSQLNSSQCVLIRCIVATLSWFIFMVPVLAAPDGWAFIGAVFSHPLTLLITAVYALTMLIDLVLYYKSIDLIGPGKAGCLNVTYTIFALLFGFLFSVIIPDYPFSPPGVLFYIVAVLLLAGNVILIDPRSDADDSSILKLEEEKMKDMK